MTKNFIYCAKLPKLDFKITFFEVIGFKEGGWVKPNLDNSLIGIPIKLGLPNNDSIDECEKFSR